MRYGESSERATSRNDLFSIPCASCRRLRKQKTDRQDAQLILRWMLEDRFPQIWVPSWENRDLRQLLWHRHRMVQARTRIMKPTTSRGAERGPTLQEEVVAGSRTGKTTVPWPCCDAGQ